MSEDRGVILLIVVAIAFIFVGRRLQRTIDLYGRWRKAIADLQGARAALPGIRKDFRGGVFTLAKVILVGAFLIWAASNIDVLTS